MSDEIKGAAREIGGRAQETFGNGFGDTKLQAEGTYNQAAGRVKQAMGQAQDAAIQFTDMVRSQPLISATVALGVGYLLRRMR